MTTHPDIQWQPLSMLPAVVRMAEEALADAEALANIRAGYDRPGVLDTAMELIRRGLDPRPAPRAGKAAAKAPNKATSPSARRGARPARTAG